MIIKKLQLISCLILTYLFFATTAHSQRTISGKEIIAEAEKMALVQFEAQRWNFWCRSWVDGVGFAGVADLGKVSSNPKIFGAIKRAGDRACSHKGRYGRKTYGAWCLFHVDEKKEPHHADDMTMAQGFLEYYAKTKDPKILVDIEKRVGAASKHILSTEMAEKAKRAKQLPWNKGITWYWCDALFMAAPVHARLTDLTGNPLYLKAMHVEWARVSDLLYDKEEHLYYRDAKHLPRKTKHGKKLFWSRGNGWVMGALARTLRYIPKDDPKRPFYVKQLKEMSAKLASIQRPDGTWSPSLLDYKHFPYSETSGTALYCFAMAWGINNGILSKEKYLPVVTKAWAAMLAARTERGDMGYVQGVGDQPRPVHASHRTWYGNGAFYMAAVQLAKMAPIELPPAPQLKAAPPRRRR